MNRRGDGFAREALAWVMALAMSGCAAAPPEASLCESTSAAAVERAALNGGADSPQYLAMSVEQAASIVRVRQVISGASCTGTIVASGWVLTAAHCESADGSPLQIVRIDVASGAEEVATATESVVHESLDLMLLKLEGPAFENASPLPVALELPETRVGELAQVAGFTRGGDGSEKPAFAVEQIVMQDDDVLTVTADGYAGACLGDSGGPALGRSASGGLEVWGILMGGSVSCWGEDAYQRVDGASEWIAATTGEDPAADEDCGELGSQGRCFGDRAAWCERGDDGGEHVAGAECGPDLRCGWDSALMGFRCVAAHDDPCGGHSDLGDCESGDALRCVDGTLERNACSRCSATCVRSPQTGRAVCVPAAARP